MVAVANKSSRDTSRRVARRAQQRAEEGRWHGGWAPYGYEWARDWTGTITGLQECPERATLGGSASCTGLWRSESSSQLRELGRAPCTRLT